MEYSYYAAPSIMPLIHPSEDDLAMGAVDYLLPNPLGNVTNPSTSVNATIPVNATLTEKVINTIRDVVPRVVGHAVSAIASETPQVVVPVSDGEQHEELPINVQIDLIPPVTAQACF
jgi:hypothetical protein